MQRSVYRSVLSAVVLALAYELVLVWMNPDKAGESGQAVTEQE